MKTCLLNLAYKSFSHYIRTSCFNDMHSDDSNGNEKFTNKVGNSKGNYHVGNFAEVCKKFERARVKQISSIKLSSSQLGA